MRPDLLAALRGMDTPGSDRCVVFPDGTPVGCAAADEIKRLRAALDQIAKMRPKRVTEDFVTGPQSMLDACQRIARKALKR